MLKRHEVEVLLKAGHSQTEVARLAKPSTEQLRPEIPKLTAGELEALMRRLNLAQTRRIYEEVVDRAEKEE